jgi:hypothetical protein
MVGVSRQRVNASRQMLDDVLGDREVTFSATVKMLKGMMSGFLDISQLRGGRLLVMRGVSALMFCVVVSVCHGFPCLTLHPNLFYTFIILS